MPDFTPGPWLLTTFHGGGFTVEAGPDGLVICDRNALRHRAEESKANARLISASPTMYDYIKTRADEGDERAAAIIASVG